MQADMRALRMLTLARRCCAGGERALLIAARAGCEDLVELIAGFKTNVNVSDATGKTALLQDPCIGRAKRGISQWCRSS